MDDTLVDLPPISDPPPIPKQVMHWHGNATGSWWAVIPGRQGPRLIEAHSRDQLAVMVDWEFRMAGVR